MLYTFLNISIYSIYMSIKINVFFRNFEKVLIQHRFPQLQMYSLMTSLILYTIEIESSTMYRKQKCRKANIYKWILRSSISNSLLQYSICKVYSEKGINVLYSNLMKVMNHGNRLNLYTAFICCIINAANCEFA